MMKGTNHPQELAAKKDPLSQEKGFLFNNSGSQVGQIQQDKDQHTARGRQMESAAGRYKSFRRQPR